MADDKQSTFRSEDFQEVYSNNIQLESSLWDLKMIFGQLDQRQGRVDVEQRVAVTIPWKQVKLLAYFLQANIFFHEKENGRIMLPAGVLPPDPNTVFKDMEDNPKNKEVMEHMQRLRDALIASST